MPHPFLYDCYRCNLNQIKLRCQLHVSYGLWNFHWYWPRWSLSSLPWDKSPMFWEEPRRNWERWLRQWKWFHVKLSMSGWTANGDSFEHYKSSTATWHLWLCMAAIGTILLSEGFPNFPIGHSCGRTDSQRDVVVLTCKVSNPVHVSQWYGAWLWIHQSFLGSVVVDIFTSRAPVRQSKLYTSSFPDPFLMKFRYTDPIPSRKLKRGSNWGGRSLCRDLSDSSFRHAAQYLEHCIKPSLNSPQNLLSPES